MRLSSYFISNIKKTGEHSEPGTLCPNKTTNQSQNPVATLNIKTGPKFVRSYGRPLYPRMIWIYIIHAFERTELEKITARVFPDDYTEYKPNAHYCQVNMYLQFVMHQASAFKLKFYRLCCTKCNLL